MLYSYAENQHVEKMDYARMSAEIRALTRVAATMDGADRAALCVGMTPELALEVPDASLGPCFDTLTDLGPQ